MNLDTTVLAGSDRLRPTKATGSRSHLTAVGREWRPSGDEGIVESIEVSMLWQQAALQVDPMKLGCRQESCVPLG